MDTCLRAVGAVGYLMNGTAAGSVPNAGGSQGTLCLGGSVGRHHGPGQVMLADGAGQMALQLDLTRVPPPTGTGAATSGQTWRFQCRYRDANPGVSSNFSSAVELGF